MKGLSVPFVFVDSVSQLFIVCAIVIGFCKVEKYTCINWLCSST